VKRPRSLSDCHNVLDLREVAKRRLPSPIFEFMDGGAETEATLRRNTEAFDEEKLIPKCLIDVASVNMSTQILGQDIAWPVFCGPTGTSRLFHPDGELAVARAAASAGTLYSLGMGSTYSLEDVAHASDGPKLFQLTLYKNRDIMRGLIERAKRLRYSALCLTVDVPVIGKRERDLRSGFRLKPKWTLEFAMSFARHPRWVAGRLRKGPLSLANLKGVDRSKGVEQHLDSSVTWKDVREIIDQWGGPFALKGVMAVEDARRAADEGVTAVIVSNHGGRQLDGAAAPIEVLPEIARAVGNRIELILDGGIRRGVHVLKALALGAKACSIGRPYLYGLSAGGEMGVAKALDILRSELTVAMKLSGCADIRSIPKTMIMRSL
jgi:L-lactate dehydrogenase (cytochrome)